ncbi:MAG: TrmH family RNA methyltransferase [Candidatus Saccharibacteria bacterium]|nr:TrmH family RNA methyltransferase [Candidatus Saccharibacteria bacterium]
MEIILLLHNIRSIHNVGSIMRTAEGFGLKKIITSGYTPHPRLTNDSRLPHITDKIEKELHKTALDAEKILEIEYYQDPLDAITHYKQHNYQIIALEQNKQSINLKDFHLTNKALVILGEEVHGITSELISKADTILEISMAGQKESFNVSVATGICLYQLTQF